MIQLIQPEMLTIICKWTLKVGSYFTDAAQKRLEIILTLAGASCGRILQGRGERKYESAFKAFFLKLTALQVGTELSETLNRK